jgi:hypothetical protein
MHSGEASLKLAVFSAALNQIPFYIVLFEITRYLVKCAPGNVESGRIGERHGGR